MFQSILFFMFLVLSLFALHGLIHGNFSYLEKLVQKSSRTQMLLRNYIGKKPPKKIINRYLVFAEEDVYSISNRFRGRFDIAILHWEESPILDALFERKFPTRSLPRNPHEYDIFQASLYALALMDSGVSCSSTKIVVAYCRQEDAIKCQHNRAIASCLRCDRGAVFTSNFSPRETMRKLDSLNQYWFQNRKPQASPDTRKCTICPYASKQFCQWSKAKQKSND